MVSDAAHDGKVTDSSLLQLMLHHLTSENEPHDIRSARMLIIVHEMDERHARKTVYHADIRVSQHIRIAVGRCGYGDDARIVESGFDVEVGDQLLVYRGEK